MKHKDMEKDYPSYVPDDFRGLDSIQEGNQRYYYQTKDGQNLLVGAIVGKRHLVTRYRGRQQRHRQHIQSNN